MPVSRILFSDFSESSSFICDDDCSPPVAPNPSVSREPRSNTDIRGLTIRKVYPNPDFHRETVSFYLTFSPSLRRAVIFCGTISTPHCCGESRYYRDAVLYIVRTFLSFLQRTMKQHAAVRENRRLI